MTCGLIVFTLRDILFLIVAGLIGIVALVLGLFFALGWLCDWLSRKFIWKGKKP